MYGLKQFWQSTIGKKIVMAVTGIIGILFVIGHMSGNLLMFSGKSAIDDYAVLLRTSMPLLWAVRLGLTAAVVLHVVSAVQLTRRAQAARPQGYAVRKAPVTTLAARTIRAGGMLLLLFIVFHLLHMTLGVIHPDFVHLDPYDNIRIGLANPLIAGFYILAMAALGLHLYHGTWSAFRTLGVARSSHHPLKRRLALVVAVVVAVGFAIIPVATVAGFFPEELTMETSVQAPAGPETATSSVPVTPSLAETN